MRSNDKLITIYNMKMGVVINRLVGNLSVENKEGFIYVKNMGSVIFSIPTNDCTSGHDVIGYTVVEIQYTDKFYKKFRS